MRSPLELTFVIGNLQADNDNECYWHTKPFDGMNGELMEHYGKRLALEAVEFIKTNDFAPLLSWIVKDMAEDFEFDAVKLGFLGTIATLAAKGLESEGRH